MSRSCVHVDLADAAVGAGHGVGTWPRVPTGWAGAGVDPPLGRRDPDGVAGPRRPAERPALTGALVRGVQFPAVPGAGRGGSAQAGRVEVVGHRFAGVGVGLGDRRQRRARRRSACSPRPSRRRRAAGRAARAARASRSGRSARSCAASPRAAAQSLARTMNPPNPPVDVLQAARARRSCRRACRRARCPARSPPPAWCRCACRRRGGSTGPARARARRARRRSPPRATRRGAPGAPAASPPGGASRPVAAAACSPSAHCAARSFLPPISPAPSDSTPTPCVPGAHHARRRRRARHGDRQRAVHRQHLQAGLVQLEPVGAVRDDLAGEQPDDRRRAPRPSAAAA